MAIERYWQPSEDPSPTIPTNRTEEDKGKKRKPKLILKEYWHGS